MRSLDLTGIFVFSLLVGGIFTFLGSTIKRFNASDIIILTKKSMIKIKLQN